LERNVSRKRESAQSNQSGADLGKIHSKIKDIGVKIILERTCMYHEHEIMMEQEKLF
jgi:hypothetical protein